MIPFLLTALIAILVPGPDLLYVVGRGVARGPEVGLIAAGGISTGLVCHALLAAVGLSALLTSSAVAFSAVKFAGAAYLIYLGAKSLLGEGGFVVPLEEYQDGAHRGQRTLRLSVVFWQGVLTNVLNPKAVLFFFAFLPQFVRPEAGNASWQVLVLGCSIAPIALAVFGTIALVSGRLGHLLRREPALADGFGKLAGCIFVGLGLRLALSER